MTALAPKPFGVVTPGDIVALRAAFNMPPPRVLVDDVVEAVGERMRLTRAQIVRSSGSSTYSRARAAVTWIAREVCPCTLAAIGHHLTARPDNAWSMIAQANRLRRDDPAFAAMTEDLRAHFAWRAR